MRILAYLGGAAVLSTVASHLFQSPKVMGAITPVDPPEWIDVERPFRAFALSIPEAADAPAKYTIRRHATGGRRKDIVESGEPGGALPSLHVEIYRAGSEILGFDDPETAIIANARALGPTHLAPLAEPLPSKFGPLTLVSFIAAKGTQRSCLRRGIH